MIKHKLEYSIWSAKITWCDICKEHFYNTENNEHILDDKKEETKVVGVQLPVIQPNSFINGDCMEFMRTCPPNFFDLAIVDPPYGGKDAIGMKDNIGMKKQATARTNYKLFENVSPPVEYFEQLKRISKDQIIFGVNFYKNVDLSGGRIVWDKKGTAFGRAEEAYYSGSNSVNIIEYIWNGMLQQDMRDKEERIHPTQKPVGLYKILLREYAKAGDLILDTHVGSASSLIACVELGFNYVGLEIDKEYYTMAKSRLGRATRKYELFEAV